MGKIELAARVRRLLVDVRDLGRLLRDGARFRTVGDVPPDAKLVAAGMVDSERAILSVGFEHDSFDAVAPGLVPPELKVTFVHEVADWRAQYEELRAAAERVIDDPGLLRWARGEYDETEALRDIEDTLRAGLGRPPLPRDVGERVSARNAEDGQHRANDAQAATGCGADKDEALGRVYQTVLLRCVGCGTESVAERADDAHRPCGRCGRVLDVVV